MKKVLFVLIAALLLAFLVGCQGGKPADMDQTTYDLAQEAISVGEGCVSGKTYPSDGARRLGAIYDELEAYAPKNSTSHVIVKTNVLSMKMEALEVSGEMDKAEMQKLVGQLKEACK